MQSIHYDYKRDRFHLHYQYIICSDLILKENYSNISQLSCFKKIVINTTSNYYVVDKKNLIPAFIALELVTGQKTQLTSARKSIAPFKIRENQALGCKITLRKSRLYNFLNLFTTIILPRLRDFNHISCKNLDKSGNLSLGFTDLLLFPQLENHFEYFQNFKGIHINFITNSSKLQKNYLLYSGFQLPLA